MLAVCTSSYGYFLIYNLSGTIKGVDDGAKVSIPFKGYLVMAFNDDTDLFEDSNMIIYGKNPAKTKVYVQLNENGTNQFLESDIWHPDIKDFYEFGGESPFGFMATMMGDIKSTDIGTDVPRTIATRLKGVITSREGMLLDINQEISGIGTISASLYTVATKAVNDFFAPWTQDEVLEELRVILEEDKGYTPVSIP